MFDFKNLSKNIINDTYPIHQVEDQLKKMSEPSVFLTLDLAKG